MLAGWPALSPQDPLSALTAEDVARGGRLYVGHCALCHGIEGTGGRGPRLNQPELRRVAGNTELFGVIRNGLEGTEMPGFWQMTEREVWQVAGYVRSLGRSAVVELPGDAARGRALYENAGGCAACHIVRGRGGSSGPDLSAVGARRSPAYLREALTDPGAAVPVGYLVARVTIRDGREVRGVRLNEDTFTIQLRDAAGRLHSFRKLELRDLRREPGVSTMPGYATKLTAPEIEDLVAYMATLRGQK